MSVSFTEWNGDVNRCTQGGFNDLSGDEDHDEENYYTTPVHERRSAYQPQDQRQQQQQQRSPVHLQSPTLLQHHPNPILAIHLERQKERRKAEQERQQQVIQRQNMMMQRPSQEHLYQNVRDTHKAHFGPY